MCVCGGWGGGGVGGGGGVQKVSVLSNSCETNRRAKREHLTLLASQSHLILITH